MARKDYFTAARRASAGPSRIGRLATDSSYDEIRRVIGRSFAGTSDVAGEPTIAWVFAHCCNLGQEDKVATVTFFMSVELKEVLRQKPLVLTKVLDDGEIAATVVVREYDASKKKSFLQKQALEWRKAWTGITLFCSDGIPVFLKSRKCAGDRNVVITKVEEFLKCTLLWHAEYGPKGSHWYVNIVATNPDMQGQGHGSDMMRQVCSLADSEGKWLYLEAGDEKNKNFYEKFGFHVVSSPALTNPADAMDKHVLYLMVREAQGKGKSDRSNT